MVPILSSLHVNNNRINEIGTIEMAGNEVYKIAVKRLSDLAEGNFKKLQYDFR